jgi:tellurite resistance-related uncharacterized protein
MIDESLPMVSMHLLSVRLIMSHLRIPKNWKIQRSTPFFTKDNVPAALLSHHNTAEGVFGQLCVMEGTVTYYGFADENATEPEAIIAIHAGQFATSPPEYWHRVELSNDAQFNINFWSNKDKTGQALFNAKK